MYTVCFVEDDPDARQLLVDTIQICRRLELLGAYSSGEEAIRELPAVKPDVVLMDIKMPGMSGIQCVSALRDLSPLCSCSILMLTEYDKDDLVIEAFKSGANGYLLKRFAHGQRLQAAIIEVMTGGAPMSPGIGRKMVANLHRPRLANALGRSYVASTAPPLTECEGEVLHDLTDGLAYKEMADHLDVSLNTVRKHLRNIYYKLDVHSRCDPRLYAASRQYPDRRSPSR